MKTMRRGDPERKFLLGTINRRLDTLSRASVVPLEVRTQLQRN